MVMTSMKLIQDKELEEAIAAYTEGLHDLELLLETDATNAEALELQQQLQEALLYTKSAYELAKNGKSPGSRTSLAALAAEASASAPAEIEGDVEEGEEVSTSHAVEDGDIQGSNAEEVGSKHEQLASGPLRGKDDGQAAVGPASQAEALTPARMGKGAARMHPNNKYYREEPDYAALAAKYPELKKYITLGPGGRAQFDYTSWEGTRQLTATLLKHDFGIQWWLPEGQLVPPVTNRANYIHWIFDLLQLSSPEGLPVTKGLDIGCGANFIYCLLGAAIYGWHMVGVDITDVTLEWSQRHIKNNPQLRRLLEVRKSGEAASTANDIAQEPPGNAGQPAAEAGNNQLHGTQASVSPRISDHGSADVDQQHRRHSMEAAQRLQPHALKPSEPEALEPDDDLERHRKAPRQERGPLPRQPPAAAAAAAPAAPSNAGAHAGPDTLGADAASRAAWDLEPDEFDDSEVGGILTAALRDDAEVFSFSMCNPPFFSSMSEANANPATAHGGTAAEMVYPGGELAFIMRMVEDSVRLGGRIHWYTTMVCKKTTLKQLRKELHTRHVTAIRTTEFSQGKTSRWAIAWSFDVDPNTASQPLPRAVNPALKQPIQAKRMISFTLQGSQQDGRKLLKTLESVLAAHGATNCAIDLSMWTITANLPAAGPPTDAGPASGTADSSKAAQQGPAGMPAKKPRVDGSRAGAAGGSGAGGKGGLSMRINVYQQQRGKFDIVATIPNSSSGDDAMCFTLMMQRMQEDATAMWL